MARKLSAAQAKSHLADCLRKAENGEPVIITRHGKAVAALVGMDRVALVQALTKVRRTRPRRLCTILDEARTSRR